MSEMVERVALAILAKCEEFESRKGDIMEFDSRELARAAIAAMREPTDDMRVPESAKGIWRAMIDEALR